jgi:hypothetical protein
LLRLAPLPLPPFAALLVLVAVAACSDANPRYRPNERGDAPAPPDAQSPPDARADVSAADPDAPPPADAASEASPGGADVLAEGPPTTPGLLGEYYEGRDFGTFKLRRTDPTIDFRWVHAAPDPAVPADDFSVRWTGFVEPLASEMYTFFTATDDGVRLWVDGVLLVDHWVNQSETENSGQIRLVAGRRHSIKMEYFDGTLTATARLFWSSPSRAKEIVPSRSLTTP